jgi:hypothetical protein
MAVTTPNLTKFYARLQNSRKVTTSFVMSVCPYIRPSVCPNGTSRLTTDGYE